MRNVDRSRKRASCAVSIIAVYAAVTTDDSFASFVKPARGSHLERAASRRAASRARAAQPPRRAGAHRVDQIQILGFGQDALRQELLEPRGVLHQQTLALLLDDRRRFRLFPFAPDVLLHLALHLLLVHRALHRRQPLHLALVLLHLHAPLLRVHLLQAVLLREPLEHDLAELLLLRLFLQTHRRANRLLVLVRRNHLRRRRRRRRSASRPRRRACPPRGTRRRRRARRP
mmetsp:Transcript_6778/g.27655  ORF Transcript_6778/g.27655 Transcript_6778/m.27655 type:complete len:230 (+) Transcript_6778:1173-1862(+)